MCLSRMSNNDGIKNDEKQQPRVKHEKTVIQTHTVTVEERISVRLMNGTEDRK